MLDKRDSCAITYIFIVVMSLHAKSFGRNESSLTKIGKNLSLSKR